MTRNAVRAVLTGGGACLAIAFIFVSARMFFRNYFILTNRPDPLIFALPFLAVFVLLGFVHATSSPLPELSDPTYKESSGR
jgi:nitrate reductase gamma subunit